MVISVASAKYMQVAYFLPHMVLAAGLYSIGDTLCIKLMSDIRIKEIMKIKIASSVVGVVMNGFGAAMYGLIGVVYGAIFFGFIYMAMFVLVYFNFSNQKNAINGC